LEGSNFSKLNKYVVSDFPKHPKELAHILDQWPAKFHFEIWWHFLLNEAQNISGNKETLCRGSDPTNFTRCRQVFPLTLTGLLLWVFMLAEYQDGALCTGVCTSNIILQLQHIVDAFQDIHTFKKIW